MRTIIKKFLFILLLMFCNTIYANTYYVCDSGDDNNTGLTPNDPWKTFDKGMSVFGLLKAGESIAFCRGGVFDANEFKARFNLNCRAEKPCEIKDYYTPFSKGEEPLPEIINSSTSNAIFYFNTRKAGNEIPDGGVVIQNLKLIGAGNGYGVYVLNGFSDMMIQNVIIDGFRVGIYIAEGANKSSRITFKNSIIINNAEQGWLGGCSDCLIDSNVFSNNGYLKSNLGHNVYISGNGIRNITFSNNWLSKSTLSNGVCSGVSLVAHGVISEFKLLSNTIIEDVDKAAPGCYGIGIGPGYSTEESFANLVIKNNTIYNVGNVAIGCASCTDVIIENNEISNVNNVFHEAIKIPVGAEDSIKSARIKIQGNTINILKGIMERYIKQGIRVNLEDLEDVIIDRNAVIYDNNSYGCIEINGITQTSGNNTCLKI